jgi:hypothetical protein
MSSDINDGHAVRNPDFIRFPLCGLEHAFRISETQALNHSHHLNLAK